jgi:O-antigen biosynthesis protein WbqV
VKLSIPEIVRRAWVAAFHDILMAAASFVLSLYLRLGNDEFYKADSFLLPGTLIFTGVCAIIFWAMRLYRGVWRYASVPDLVAITKSVTLAILVFLPIMFMVNRLEGVPRSMLAINWMVLLVLLGGPRFLYRLVKDKRLLIDFNSSAVDKRIPILLAGITDNAELFLRETTRRSTSEYRVVGIVDKNVSRVGRVLHGVRVYGDYTVIPKVVDKLRKKGKSPQKIVLAEEHPDKEFIARLLAIADELGLSVARLPKRSELQHASEPFRMRPIAVEDLLGRPQATLDRESMRRFIEGKRVLITGAGGTIGSELVRQIAGSAPAHITLFELSEYNLYSIDSELATLFPTLSRSAVIGDVRNPKQLDAIFTTHKPNIVFHAAALKHVPIAEENPIEAAYTNTLGSRYVADMCVAHNVSTMIMISTDKAVNPTSFMGATKRVAESYCQALGGAFTEAPTTFTTVRFGNVLGSSGSVIPLFARQLEAGGPLTVTHPDMVRYFMTVREAVELVLQAAVLGTTRDDKSAIFVLDMGEPVRILDLASQMIRMAGLRPDMDIPIVFTGLRPGEKLYEELFYDSEALHKTAHPGIMLAQPRAVDYTEISQKLDGMLEATASQDAEYVVDLVQEIVPEYRSSLPRRKGTYKPAKRVNYKKEVKPHATKIVAEA